jgi:hypothetical protein
VPGLADRKVTGLLVEPATPRRPERSPGTPSEELRCPAVRRRIPPRTLPRGVLSRPAASGLGLPVRLRFATVVEFVVSGEQVTVTGDGGEQLVVGADVGDGWRFGFAGAPSMRATAVGQHRPSKPDVRQRLS